MAVTATGLSLRKVGKRYGAHRALIDVSATFYPGDVTVVLGPNGAGKTTLLGILASLIAPTSGEVLWNGEPFRRTALERARIGYVGHEPGIYGDLTARENLAFFAGLYGLSDAGERIGEMLNRVGLADVDEGRSGAPRIARTFSRGMQQRLALGRALLHEPSLLLFDEPSSALDPRGAQWLVEQLRVNRDAGRAVVLVTHDLDVAGAVANRTLLIQRGRLAHEASWASPAGAETLRSLYEEQTRG